MSIDLLIAGIPLAGYGYVLWLAHVGPQAIGARRPRGGPG
jgi:hypothetical protein